MLSPVINYDSDTSGEDSKTKNMDYFPSTIYLTHKYNEKLSTGLGVFTPFGLGTKWSKHLGGMGIKFMEDSQLLKMIDSLAGSRSSALTKT